MSRVSRHKVSRGMVKKKLKKIERRKEKEKYRKSGKKEKNTAVYAFRHINSNTSSPCLPPREI